MLKWPAWAAVLATLLVLGACGQKGALYMQPVAAPAAAAASAPAR